MTVGVQDATSTYDCAWPHCPREARVRGGYCDVGHVGTPPADVAPGSLAHITDDPCKVDGCGNASAGKRGWATGLCQQHIDEGMKQRVASRKGRKRATPEPPAPTPAAAPAAVPVAAAADGDPEAGMRITREIAGLTGSDQPNLADAAVALEETLHSVELRRIALANAERDLRDVYAYTKAEAAEIDQRVAGALS